MAALKKLEWSDGETFHHAQTHFGTITITHFGAIGDRPAQTKLSLPWLNLGRITVNGIEDGKRRAQHSLERHVRKHISSLFEDTQ